MWLNKKSISATWQFLASTMKVSKPVVHLTHVTYNNLLLFLWLFGSRHHNFTKIAMMKWLSYRVDFLQVWNDTPKMSCNPISPVEVRMNTRAFNDKNFSNHILLCLIPVKSNIWQLVLWLGKISFLYLREISTSITQFYFSSVDSLWKIFRPIFKGN